MLLAVGLLQQRLTNGVTSDGCLYFAHLRSLVFDHDLQIGPELEILHLPPRPHDVVPIGPAILWAPLYLLVAAADWAGEWLGFWTRASGTALGLTGPYARAAFVSSFAAAAVGLVALHLRVRREFGRSTALLASGITLGATTLVWYVIFEPSMTHAPSFGTVALALVMTERWLVEREPTTRQGVTLGLLFSLVIITRPEDAVFLAFPAAALLFAPRYAGRRTPSILRTGRDMLVGAAPLLVVQVVMIARLLSANQFMLSGDQGYLNIWSSQWVDVLFSSRHGLLSWTPVVWVGLLGTVLYARRNPLWAVPALLAFVVLVWTNGSTQDWAGGWAFGGRRFTSVLAAFTPGMAAALAWTRRHPLAIIAPAAALVVGWNALLMSQYERQMLPPDESIRFDTLVRQQTELYLTPPYWYPFAFPANVLFAWREGLPIDRYDLLGSEPLRRQMYLPLNDWGSRFLLDGWENGAGDAFGSRHFLIGRQGTVVVPLDVPAATPFSVELEARADGPPLLGTAHLDVALNERPFGSVDLPIGAVPPARRAFIVPAGAHLWRRGYNRVTISRRGDVPPGVSLIVYALRLGPVQAR